MTKKDKTSDAADAEVVEPEVIDSDEDVEETSSSEESTSKADANGSAKDKSPEDELAAAKAEAAEAKDRYLRLQAEWDNFRKRSASERADERNRACERLVSNLLPVVDDFERAIAHAKEDPDAETLVDGITAVHSKLVGVLEKEQVSVIDPKGEAFDATRHQAVSKKEDDSIPDETVTEVFQKGYAMGGKILRPAMVVISSGGPVREKEPDDGEKAAEDTEE